MASAPMTRMRTSTFPPPPAANANGAKIHQPEKTRKKVRTPAATQRMVARRERTVQTNVVYQSIVTQGSSPSTQAGCPGEISR
jgi:hypothetical protein